MQPLRPPRPTGITIIAVLAILIGVLGILGGIAIVGFSTLLSTSTLGSANAAFLTGFGLILGGIVVIFSLIWLGVGVGLLHGKGWAWTLGMLFSVLSIIGAASLVAVGGYSGIVGVLVWGMMIYYLTRNRVKSFFGKGPQSWAPQAFTPTPAFSSPAFASSTMRTPPGTTSTFNAETSQGATAKLNWFCTQCGATITPGSTKCSSCGKDL